MITGLLAAELGDLLTLADAHGEPALLEALSRATAFGRWRADEVRSILASGHAAPTRVRPGTPACLQADTPVMV